MGVMKSLNTSMMLGDKSIQMQVHARMGAMFFDRHIVMAATDKACRKVLSKFGANVRRSAKQSIRKRKKASQPGQPPSGHVGTLKRLIFFGYEANKKNVVIGPLPIGAIGSAPEALEYGGKIRKRNARRTKRTVGGSGEIRIDGTFSATTKTNKEGFAITYARLRTQAQADRANEINASLYGPDIIEGGTIAPRPFMHPAFDKNKTTLPSLWENSIK